MRVPAKARVLVVGTVALGAGVLAVAAAKAAAAPLTTLALLAAAVVVAELFQVPSDERSLDPVDAHIFSFSAGVHVAAILLVGPWEAALIAAFGVLAVDRLRGMHWEKVAFNASAFALATLAAGSVYQLLGGVPGALDLPAAFPAIAALAVTYSTLNTAFVSSVVAFSSGTPLWPVFRGSTMAELPATAAEAGLGLAIALLALFQPWAIVALLPLGIAVYQAHARLALLRRETARALETFANVVDERDAYTYRHSARVAEYVRGVAQALGLPGSDVARLRWAGRLHDLGKIAVDTGVLRKSGKLTDDEWAAMLRHPRLSARLLRRFRFAAEEARAVEYHHERFDGGGYYGIDARELPLEAHFLIVADTFDAMTTDRPYRRALSRELALAEIERNAGSQFHPAVAKAFVAFQRGTDPLAALSPEERAQLDRRLVRRGRLRGHRRIRPELVALGGVIAALACVGIGRPALGVGGLAVALTGLAWRHLELARARRLAADLRRLLGAPSRRDLLFRRVAALLADGAGLRWAGLVGWKEHDLVGWIELAAGAAEDGPSETALTSWLIREAEGDRDLLVAAGSELGGSGVYAALPLRRAGSLVAFLVLSFGRSIPRHAELALRATAADLAHTLAQPLREASGLGPRAVAAAS